MALVRTLSVPLAVWALYVALLPMACGGGATPDSPTGVPRCDPALWGHVYDPARLQVMQDCLTVAGVITDFHPNDDGDIDIRIEVDPAYKNLLNGKNVSELSGHLQTEAICQVTPTTASAIAACAGFTGSIAVPSVGTHVQITGRYVLDTWHGWMEIHPISVLTIR